MAQEETQQEKLNQQEIEEKEDAGLKEYGQMTLEENGARRKIHLLTIIGDVEGLLVLLNTSGGDVEAGLAIAEMIASLSLPTVSLVLGGSHSIGVPLAVSADYSFIVPSGTMMIHPVRMTGMVIGTAQTYEYFEMIQDRILTFVADHANVDYETLKGLMHNTKMLTRDLGTMLVGKEAVDAGLINQVGGIREALKKLYQMIDLGTDERKTQS